MRYSTWERLEQPMGTSSSKHTIHDAIAQLKTTAGQGLYKHGENASNEHFYKCSRIDKMEEKGEPPVYANTEKDVRQGSVALGADDVGAIPKGTIGTINSRMRWSIVAAMFGMIDSGFKNQILCMRPKPES